MFRAFALAVALLAQASFSVAAAGPTAPSDETSAGGLAPGIHWEEARAHEDDRIAFTAGERVSVGFKPRPEDRWVVGGVTPRSLPPGRLDGKRMRLQKPADPVDRPVVDESDVIDATAASWSPPAAPEARTPQARVGAGLRREVFGFLPYWQVGSSSLRINYDKISTIAYFGVGAAADGNLQKRTSDGSTTVGWSGWTSSKLTTIINRAHATGTRVVLTVQSFAWTSSGRTRQRALLASPTARSRLARQVAAAVRDRGADGVNLDFEPLVSGSESQFTALVRTVRSELDKVARGYQLTFDTTGFIGNYPIEAATAAGGADAIFIMGYDYRGSSSSPVGSVAPLSRSGYDIRETVAAYVARVPPSKLILGVPYYGRAWSTATSSAHARNISGTKYGSSAAVTYINALPFLSRYGRRYDATEGVAWTVYRRQNCTSTYGCVNPWRQLYVDDYRAIRAKYDLVNRYDLRGAGIWALGYDGTRTELWSAIKSKFIADRVPPSIATPSASAVHFSPNGDGTLDATTARVRITGHVKWGYRVQSVAGSVVGAPLRTGTRTAGSPAYRWDGRNASGAIVPDGVYRVTFWAEDASANHAERYVHVRVDTRRANAGSSAGIGFITPDRDRKADTLPLRWSATEPLTGYVTVRNAAGAPIRSWSISAKTSGAITWDGRDRSAAVAADGPYTFRVDGRDRAGNRTTVDRRVNVDRTILSVLWSATTFDTRARETSRASIRLRRAAVVNVGIYRGETLVRRIWTDKSLARGTYGYTWDGRTASGNFVAPGTYRIKVSARSWIGTTWYVRNVVIGAH
jgi:spore germination protein YaaH/flagellar hook assembly protein FlgD